MDENLQRSVNLLEENEHDERQKAKSVLFTLCKNILSHPENKGYREVRLDDPNVTEKLFPASGAMECLFDVGFVDDGDRLLLPQEASLSKVEALHKLLGRTLKPDSVEAHRINNSEFRNLLPAATMPMEEKFFLDMAVELENFKRYEDFNLQEKARKLVPIVELEIATLSRIRELQMHIKSNQKKDDVNGINDADIVAKDFFLAELLQWFKEKFFTWVNSPTCPKCLGESSFYKIVSSNDPNCSRIELHRCTNCKTLVKFPRYTNPDILLTTRCGRCGEWAYVFTLFCRSLGYDTRLIRDETDHVWTEVWSIPKNRWIHADPCENMMDRPLMYEKGWKKKLTYIIAYSKDEVQDVTWRYTRDQKAVMGRRKCCTEKNLLKFIESLNKHHQTSANYSPARRQYVIKRRLLELVELIHLPNQRDLDDNESYYGRTTGSYAWNLSRGEVSQQNVDANHIWDISKYGQTFKLHYFIVKDWYKVIGDDGETLLQKSGWKEGTYATEGGVFRKVEGDWKMVYLARTDTKHGKIAWSFQVANPNLRVWKFELRAIEKVFHGAYTSWEIRGIFDNKELESKTLPIPDCSNYRTDELQGAVKLVLTATLGGGEGDSAWQHAQIFREHLDNEDQRSMTISIKLEDR